MAVPLFGQKYNMSCWAASMRMILASRMRLVPNDDMIAAATGDEGSLVDGLNPNNSACLEHWGFRILAPRTYTSAGIVSAVQSYGPLWAACDVRFPGYSRDAPHVRVITAAPARSPVVLKMNDPWPPGVGGRYDESYPDFVRKNESLAFGELAEPRPVYLAYLP